MFDWIQFFEQHNIYYRTSGPNVGRNASVIKCIWCGAADESEHLVVSLEGKGFKCWRCKNSGKNPAKLIQALLGCSWEQANSIAGNAKTLPNDFMLKVKSILNNPEIIQSVNKLKLPAEFKQFSRLPSCKIYLDYINSRGFTIKDAEDYEVRYASQGLYKGRVIFTVQFEGKLVGWTGRTVYSSDPARYKTLTDDIEKAKDNGEIAAPAPISDYLLWYDRLVNTNANTIVLVEGPFDAWRVNVLGKHLGCVSTCFFTSAMSKQQMSLLYEILPKFENKLLLLDENTFSKAARMKSILVSLGVSIRRMPQGVKDPGLIKTMGQLKLCLQL
jgi:hypothetical protein